MRGAVLSAPSDMRCKKGNAIWQVGHEILKKASNTGPLLNSGNPKSGAVAPTASMLLLFHLTYERKDVEPLNLAIGEKAVHRLRLVVKHLENRVDLRQNQQFHVAPVQIEKLRHSASPFGAGGTHHHSAQTGTVDVVDVLQI